MKLVLESFGMNNMTNLLMDNFGHRCDAKAYISIWRCVQKVCAFSRSSNK